MNRYSTSPARRDVDFDEAPHTPRRPTSEIPPALPGERPMSFEEYAERTLARGAGLRAKSLPLKPDPVLFCNVRARRIYAVGVKKSGGCSQVARREEHGESAVRQRINTENVYPNFAQALAGFTPEGLVAVADELIAYAREKAMVSGG